MKIRLCHAGTINAAAIIIGACLFFAFLICFISRVPMGRIVYLSVAKVSPSVNPPEPIDVIRHVTTPDPLRGVYMTACAASNRESREKILQTISKSEINALVIDVKDYTGTIAYASTTVSFPGEAKRNNSSHAGCRVYDLPEFVRELHQKGLYAIARITVFQDPLYAWADRSVAVRDKNNPDKPWQDAKGLAYVDPGAKPYWDYVVAVGKEAYAIGFDELNFDYIRFPSDGDLTTILYPWSRDRLKEAALRDFFLYLREQLASTSVPLSADLFGLTTSAEGDLGIGQKLEDALAYFDYVSPMVYPSHFAYGFNGYARPTMKPYEVVKYSMDHAIVKTLMASSTPQKLRPWLQAFDLGAAYTPSMVRAQIQATYDAGLNSWMLWNAVGVYDKEALTPASSTIQRF